MKTPTQTGDKPMVTQADMEALPKDLLWSIPVGYHKAIFEAFARHREQSRDVGREALAARLLKNAEWRDDRYQCVTDPNLLKEAAEALTSRPDSVMASIVVKLSAIRNVLREAHFALDDSEDLSHQDPPVHAVPLDNVMRLHRALKACERFAPENEAWEGPGPLATQIIEWLGGLLTPPASPEQPSPSPVTGEASDTNLIDRLRLEARKQSDVSRMMAEDKSKRQPDNPTGECVYMWLKPEDTTAWKAADRIAALTTDQSQTDRLREAEWLNLMPRELVARAALNEGCRDQTAADIRDGHHRDVKIRAEVAIRLVGFIQEQVLAALSETRP